MRKAEQRMAASELELERKLEAFEADTERAQQTIDVYLTHRRRRSRRHSAFRPVSAPSRPTEA